MERYFRVGTILYARICKSIFELALRARVVPLKLTLAFHPHKTSTWRDLRTGCASLAKDASATDFAHSDVGDHNYRSTFVLLTPKISRGWRLSVAGEVRSSVYGTVIQGPRQVALHCGRTCRVFNGLKCRIGPEKPSLVHNSYTGSREPRGRVFGSQRLPVHKRRRVSEYHHSPG